MNQPKFSELLRAAALGAVAQYRWVDDPPLIMLNDSPECRQARRMQEIFDALAEVYERYEQASDQVSEVQP